MARANVVLPAPSPPCRATTSRGRRRSARLAPSRSGAPSAGRKNEEVGTDLLDADFLTRCSVTRSVAVEVGLEGTRLRHADVLGLIGTQLGEPRADLLEVQRRHLLIERLGQRIDLLLVLAGIG